MIKILYFKTLVTVCLRGKEKVRWKCNTLIMWRFLGSIRYSVHLPRKLLTLFLKYNLHPNYQENTITSVSSREVQTHLTHLLPRAAHGHSGRSGCCFAWWTLPRALGLWYVLGRSQAFGLRGVSVLWPMTLQIRQIVTACMEHIYKINWTRKEREMALNIPTNTSPGFFCMSPSVMKLNLTE